MVGNVSYPWLYSVAHVRSQIRTCGVHRQSVVVFRVLFESRLAVIRVVRNNYIICRGSS